MKYWWVNQNQTYKHEVLGGYLWSPKTKTDGSRNHFYDNMTRVQPGDIVFSFSDTYIKAVGVASGSASTSPRPTEFGSIGHYWGQEGWFVPVVYKEVPDPIRPVDHIANYSLIYLRNILLFKQTVTETRVSISQNYPPPLLLR